MEQAKRPSPSQTIESLLWIIEEQRKEIAALTACVAELERRLQLNSSNSSKPPSSDGLSMPPRTSSLREKSGKKAGGQQGRKGETLAQTATPDRVVEHYPEQCSNCGRVWDGAAGLGYRKRQVFDAPEPPPLFVTEHRAHICGCTKCGAQTQAAFPADVTAPVQYGARITALAIYLRTCQFIPEDRLAMLLKDLSGVEISAATIAAMETRTAENLAPGAEAIAQKVKEAPVKHMDESGYRIGGRTQWLHVAATVLLTFYRTSAKRGALLTDVIGVVVGSPISPCRTFSTPYATPIICAN
jgi:transposase